MSISPALEIQKKEGEENEKIREELAVLQRKIAQMEQWEFERLRVEKELNETQYFLQRIIDTTPNLIYIYDLQEHRNVYSNPGINHVLGYNPEETRDFGSALFARILHPDDFEKVEKHHARFSSVREGEVLEVSYRMKHASGRWVVLHSRDLLFSRDPEGRPKVILGTAEDVTEQERFDEEIRNLNEALKQRARELEYANKELEAFTSAVAHDLRAPLIVLNALTKKLLNTYAIHWESAPKEYVEHLYTTAQKMDRIVDALMRLSYVSRIEIKSEKVDLSALARSLVSEYRKTNADRQFDFIIGEGCVAKGDKRLLGIAMENLLGNALKFTGKRRKAKIEFGTIETEKRQAYFIRDNGCGFDMAYADLIFKPFQRLHSAEEFKGTGIGLATVKRIIDRHGGRIWVESTLDKGTTFFFTLQ